MEERKSTGEFKVWYHFTSKWISLIEDATACTACLYNNIAAVGFGFIHAHACFIVFPVIPFYISCNIIVALIGGSDTVISFLVHIIFH